MATVAVSTISWRRQGVSRYSAAASSTDTVAATSPLYCFAECEYSTKAGLKAINAEANTAKGSDKRRRAKMNSAPEAISAKISGTRRNDVLDSPIRLIAARESSRKAGGLVWSQSG